MGFTEKVWDSGCGFHCRRLGVQLSSTRCRVQGVGFRIFTPETLDPDSNIWGSGCMV